MLEIKLGADYEDLQAGMEQARKAVADGAERMRASISSMISDMQARHDAGIEKNRQFEESERQTGIQTAVYYRNMAAQVDVFAENFAKNFQKISSESRQSSGAVQGSIEEIAEGIAEGAAGLSKYAVSLVEYWNRGGSAVSELKHPVDTVTQALSNLTARMSTSLRDTAANLGSDFLASAENLASLSRQTGLTVSDLQDLQGAARASGASFDVLKTAALNLSTADDNTKIKTTLESMSVSLTDASGKMKTWKELLGDVADKFASYEDGSGKAALATALFGSSESKLIGLLDQGGKALSAYLDIFEKAGTKITDAEAQKAERLENSRRIENADAEAAAKNQSRTWGNFADEMNLIRNSDFSGWEKWRLGLSGLWNAITKNAEEAATRVQKAASLMTPGALEKQVSGAGKEPALVGAGHEAAYTAAPKDTPVTRTSVPETVTVSGLEKDLQAEQNLRENLLTWTAQKTQDYWNKAYNWAVSYYGKESNLAKDLWNKYADASRAAQQKDTGDKDQSRVGQWQYELAQKKTAAIDGQQITKQTAVEEHQAKQQELQEDIAFWTSKLALTQKDGADYVTVYEKILQLKKAALAEANQYEQKAEEDAKKTRNIQREGELAHSQAMIEVKKEQLSILYELGKIDRQQELALLQDYYGQEYQEALNAKYAELQQVTALGNQGVSEQAKIYREIQALQDNHLKRMTQANGQAAVETQSKWKSVADSMVGSFSSGISGMITGTTTLKSATQSVFGSILNTAISATARKVEMWLLGESTQTAATAAGTAARTGIEQGAAGTSLMLNATTAIKKIFNAAQETYAGVFADLSPYLGPLAVVPAGAAAALVIATGGALNFAERGWDVQSDSLAYIHKNEMVLPADIANRFRDASSAGGARHFHTWNVTCNTPKDFYAQLTDPQSQLGKAIKTIFRDGRLRVSSSGAIG